jgi:prefoldin subunit 5
MNKEIQYLQQKIEHLADKIGTTKVLLTLTHYPPSIQQKEAEIREWTAELEILKRIHGALTCKKVGS